MKNPLGRKIKAADRFDPSVLYAIERGRERRAAGLEAFPFSGFDVWHAYELSWLDASGKPQTRVLKLVYGADTPCMVESKSLKLYLAGFSMTTFASETEVTAAVRRDLEPVLRTSSINVELFGHDYERPLFKIPETQLLDRLDVELSVYKPDRTLLRAEESEGGPVERYSHLLRTNCPVTGQPDWATVYIKYKSKLKITDASLLAYLVSYRTYNGFHESTCEKIFYDLYRFLAPESLAIKCFYTRRGGIDINPMRFYGEEADAGMPYRFFRQ